VEQNVSIQTPIFKKNSSEVLHVVLMSAEHLRSSWAAYRSQMRKMAHDFPLPDMETEAALFEKLQASNFQDRHLMTRFVNPHLPGICAMANKFYGHPDFKLELIFIGNAAVMEAVRRFDLGKRVAFSNYASRSARGAMLNFILENSGIRLTTRAQRDAFWNLSHVSKELTDRGLEASNENLAEQFNERMALRRLRKFKKEESYENVQDVLSKQKSKITPEDIAKIRKLRRHCLVKSISEPRKEDEDDRTILESLESSDKSAHHLYEESDLQARIRNKMPGFIKNENLSISFLFIYFMAPISIILAVLISKPVVSKSKITIGNCSILSFPLNLEPLIPPIIATGEICLSFFRFKI